MHCVVSMNNCCAEVVALPVYARLRGAVAEDVYRMLVAVGVLPSALWSGTGTVQQTLVPIFTYPDKGAPATELYRGQVEHSDLHRKALCVRDHAKHIIDMFEDRAWRRRIKQHVHELFRVALRCVGIRVIYTMARTRVGSNRYLGRQPQ